MPQLTIIDHPLAQTRLTTLRAKDTPCDTFRRCIHSLSLLLAFEITRTWETAPHVIQTPLAELSGRKLKRPVIVAPILRAGLGMLPGMLDALPEAHVAHIGIFRDESTKLPVSYYFKGPVCEEPAEVILVDPMLATGNSAVTAAAQIKEKLNVFRLWFACLISATEGIRRFHEAHPDTPVFTTAVDDGLTPQAFITPGLGDAGDRCFGTEEAVSSYGF
jgi:uracil phosphoribosyltransferase